VADVEVAPTDLARRLQDAHERERAVGRVLHAVARAKGLQPVLDEIVASAMRLCGGEHAQLYLAEGDLFRIVSQTSDLDEAYDYARERPHLKDRTTVVGRVGLSGGVEQIPDVLEDRDYAYGAQEIVGYRALLGVPISLDDDFIGAIAVARDRPGLFPEDQVALVKTFADQAAIAILNARLIETVQRQLDQQRAFGEVLSAVARSGALQPVLDQIVDSATVLIDAENGRLWLVKDGLLHAAANFGLEETFDYDKEHPHAIDRTSMAGRAAVARDVVHVPDIEEDPEYVYSGPKPYRAGLHVPILHEDELLGVLGFTRTTPGPFSDDQIGLVTTFADQAAVAIVNARLIERVERQRTELARFVSPQVADLLSSGDAEKLLTGHRGYVTILFCDLRGFTAFTETAEPEELFEVLRDYHAAIGALIPRYEGTLEHFQGDGLMVFFNDPVPVEDHELKAIQLALAAQEHLAELCAAWRKRGIHLDLGIGIASGYATLGRVGFEGRYDYGALGSVTNLAARLTTTAGPGQTLISERVYAALEERIDAEPVGELELKGIARQVVAYAVRGLR